MQSDTGAQTALHRRSQGIMPGGRVLPMAGVVVMDDVGGRKRDDPEPDDQAADRENPSACGTVVQGQAGRLTGAEDLAANADGHQESAKNEGEPRHGVPLYPNFYRCGKGQGRPFGGSIPAGNDDDAEQNTSNRGRALRMKMMRKGQGQAVMYGEILA